LLYKYICVFSWFIWGVIYGNARNLDTSSRCVATFMLRPLVSRGKKIGTHRRGGWMVLRVGFDTPENSRILCFL